MNAEEVYGALNRKIKNIQASGGVVTDYRDLDEKPQINGVTLQGNLTSSDLGIEEFSGNYADLRDAPDALPCPFPMTFGGMLPNVSYDGSQPVNITFPNMELTNESAGTPVGEIISYMGTSAPENYLACDGKEYFVADYPHLAQHFIKNFGTSNFFGGDGEATFAVPDLRGEFLRGSGSNSRIGQGNGEDVGIHQDATLVYRELINPNIALFCKYWTNETGYLIPANADSTDRHTTNPADVKAAKIQMSMYTPSATYTTRYTTRPTNTSVLYCIKYQPTYWIAPKA